MRHFYLIFIGCFFLAVIPAHAVDFSLDQTSLDFSANAGTNPDPCPSPCITLTNESADPIHISIMTGNAPFVIIANISPSTIQPGAQATISVSLGSAGLNPNTYTGSFTVSDSSGKVKVTITLVVSGVTISAQSSYSISLIQGKSGSVKVQVTGGPASIDVSSNVGWLSPPSSADVPGSFSVVVDSSSVAVSQGNVGLLKLQCQSGGSPCVPVAVAIILNVLPAVTLQANAASLSFEAYQGRVAPPAQAFRVSTNNGTSLQFALTANATWLNVTLSSSATPATITVKVAVASLNPGQNNGMITLTPDTGGPAVAIPVTATLSPFSISTMPESPIPVSAALGQTETVPLQVATADGQPASLAIATATTDKGSWLQAPSTFKAPGTFNLTVDAAQLLQQKYTGSVTLTCSDATCAPVVISVDLTVGPPTAQITAVVGAGLSVPPVNAVSGNAIFTIFGTHLAAPHTSRNVVGSDIVNNALPSNLANTCVQGGKARWGLIYVSDTQINALADPLTTSGTVPVSVITNCGQSGESLTAPFTATAAIATPQFVFFKQDPSGHNEVVATNSSTHVNVGPPGLISGVTFVPAKGGDLLTAFGVGWGATIPAAVPGTLATEAAVLKFHHSLTIGGVAAKVDYAGLSPGSAGLFQINFTVPSGLKPGAQPIVLTIDGIPTPTGAYLQTK